MNGLLVAEVNAIIQLLENSIPANQNSISNQKLKRRLESDLVKYFDKLERAFPYSRLEAIYNRYVEKEQ